ncbi:antiviral protein MAP-like [Amaranthus tricolor]|uniref:antiviral protein MAP-like n=1 Tax=Amaranthus tricolor TaxID=29722 RepID=UPI0025878834|nr:antiviral protein MAP-like [Amaranthus tricolor]
MKKVLGGGTWVWWCMIMLIIMITTIVKQSEAQQYRTVVFELHKPDSPNGYANFLRRLRSAVSAPTRACGLNITQINPPIDREYVYIRLQFSNKQWVVLGMAARDMYIWGYTDNRPGFAPGQPPESTFLRDSPPEARQRLFPGSSRRITNYGGNYNSLQQAAGRNRNDVPLGLASLEGALKSVYGKSTSQMDEGNAEARFFLTTIQMVAEAARFRYMERGISAPPDDFRQNMIAFQNSWDTISTLIHNAEGATPKCGAFPQPLRIGFLTYGNVNEIRNEIGILKY